MWLKQIKNVETSSFLPIRLAYDQVKVILIFSEIVSNSLSHSRNVVALNWSFPSISSSICSVNFFLQILDAVKSCSNKLLKQSLHYLYSFNWKCNFFYLFSEDINFWLLSARIPRETWSRQKLSKRLICLFHTHSYLCSRFNSLSSLQTHFILISINSLLMSLGSGLN